MDLKKIIVIILLFQAAAGIFFEALYFNIPFWIEYLHFPDIFELSNTFNRLLRLLSIILTIIGAIKLIQIKDIQLLNIFKFPIYYFVISQLFWFITTLFSTKYSFFILAESAPWYSYIFKIISIAFIIIVGIHYLTKPKYELKSEPIPVKRASRFFNYFIDIVIILSLGLKNIRVLTDGFILEDYSFFNDSPNWFFAILLFMYFLIMEMVFKQTIGKLHNNSFVYCEKDTYSSIFIRNLCRFIPFEALSFFGKIGWHDSISKTTVIKP